MMRKGQVKRLAGSDARGQAKFVLNLFQVAAWRIAPDDLLRLNESLQRNRFNQQPMRASLLQVFLGCRVLHM